MDKIKNPELCVKLFFDSLNKDNRLTAWKLLSLKSKQTFVDNIYNDLRKGLSTSDEARKIKKEDIKKAFELDLPGFTRDFWKNFAESSLAKSISTHGKFKTIGNINNYSIIEIYFILPDFKKTSFQLKTIQEDSKWKVALVESNTQQ